MYPAQPGAASPPAGAGSPAPGEYVVQVIDPAGRVRGGSADAGNDAAAQPGRAAARRATPRGSSVTSVGRGRARAGDGQAAGRAPGLGRGGRGLARGLRRHAQRRHPRAGHRAAWSSWPAAGLGGYGLARAALSPVERMRREVAALSERDQAPGVQVPRTRDEIAALAATMNELLGRLQRRWPGSGPWSRTPATSCAPRSRCCAASWSWPAARGGAGRNSRPRWTRASEEAARLARITDQLLFLARSDEDRVHAAPGTDRHRRAAHPQRGARGRARPRRPVSRCEVDAPAGLIADDRPRPHPARRWTTWSTTPCGSRPAGTPIVLVRPAAGPGSGHRGRATRARLPARIPAARLRALRAPGLRAGPQRRRRWPGPGHRAAPSRRPTAAGPPRATSPAAAPWSRWSSRGPGPADPVLTVRVRLVRSLLTE